VLTIDVAQVDSSGGTHFYIKLSNSSAR